ncbi:NAD(P)H:quinone oxidoreductase type IV, partial [Mycobacterium tuberculosis]|nr:NAD(P)H:quinone oxidoreductase type IV [Mycobacterium tuberculosis]
VARGYHYKLEQREEIATVGELESYDGMVVGVSSRFGSMSAQMKNFFDQTGGLWVKGALINKVGSVMASSATQHGGQELALVSTQWPMQHHGMSIVPLSYAYQ